MHDQSEAVDDYVTRLRKLAATCNSQDLRRTLSKEPNLTLEKVLAIARTLKAVNAQVQSIYSSLQNQINRLKDKNVKSNIRNISISKQLTNIKELSQV